MSFTIYFTSFGTFKHDDTENEYGYACSIKSALTSLFSITELKYVFKLDNFQNIIGLLTRWQLSLK